MNLCNLTNDKVPDYNGFNTQRTRDSGHSLKPKSSVVFTPLLDRTPSDLSTMLTKMAEAARITHKVGQSVTVFTADQQLYRMALDILWTYEIQFTNFVPKIGGMHWVCTEFRWVYRWADEKQWFTFVVEKCFWWNRKDAYKEKVYHECQGSPLCNASYLAHLLDAYSSKSMLSIH